MIHSCTGDRYAPHILLYCESAALDDSDLHRGLNRTRRLDDRAGRRQPLGRLDEHSVRLAQTDWLSGVASDGDQDHRQTSLQPPPTILPA